APLLTLPTPAAPRNTPQRETAPAPAPITATPVPLPTLALSPTPEAVGEADERERATAAPLTAPAGPPISIAPTRRTFFGLAPAPFVEGDFVAALRLSDGKWAVVQPAPEPFPNSWQRRVLLWFAIALAIVVPLGWLFARRLVKPLDRFAGAAEQLGRDPAAEIDTLDGPAEIGRAAHAFNLMQNRLRAFVDDRTAMVGAISHDLRTPLTRMRFRIEDVEAEDVREGLLEEVDEMEAMIAQVIDFIRDASAPARRERLDLNTLVDEVVEDVRLIGGDVTIERTEEAQVEVDVLGLRRLLDNLIENAVKYGDRARIRLHRVLDEAVIEVFDDGPGLPADEMERVFEPFYRSEAARNSDKAGSGLGLAVCRSIARAHGGDIRLRNSEDGFAAELRVPLVYGSEKAALG
ncbi:ATP-binding protein, partial [Sphingomonas bacterium]|uniref:ATP-binding protein n=1 Tax=Sphingomonas bacterium TaxID=1895847 RepID=UPI00157733E6